MRLTGHSSDDQQTKYRSAEELESERARDPLPLFRAQLVEAGVLTPEVEASIAADIKAAVDDATDFSEGQPDPDPATATWWVFAEDGPAEWVPPWAGGPATADGYGEMASTDGRAAKGGGSSDGAA
jgi:TPP-dependent pyruvate/acetoin dehydrogenase alpha subunit